MQREIFSNSQLSSHDRVLAMDEKVRTYRLPDFLKSDAPLPDSHGTELGMILFQRPFLAIFIHASTLVVKLA
jgi:hypothetical protein